MDQEHRSRGEGYEWTLVILLTLMWGFVGLNRAGIGYVLPVIVPEFHLEFAQAGLLVSGTSIAWAVSAWLSGSISDRIGRKSVLLVGMYAACAFAALFGLAWNFLSLFVMRDLLGLGDGVGYTTGQSTIAEKTRPTRRALYQGIFTGGYSILGLGLGAFIITHLTTAFGWRWAFPLVGLFGFVVTTGLWIALPKSSGDATPAADRLKPTSFFLDLKEIVRIRGVVPVIIAGTLGLAWLGLYIAFASLFLTNVRGYSLDDAGTILSVSTIIGFLGPLLVPAASDMLGRKPTAIVVAIGAGVCYLAFPLVPMATPVLIAVLAVGSICSGGLAPLTLATFFSELVPHRRGAAIGIANFFSAILGATLAPIVGGVLADHMGLVAPVVLAGVCQLVIAPVLLRVPETAPRLVSRRTAPDAVHGAVV